MRDHSVDAVLMVGVVNIRITHLSLGVPHVPTGALPKERFERWNEMIRGDKEENRKGLAC